MTDQRVRQTVGTGRKVESGMNECREHEREREREREEVSRTEIEACSHSKGRPTLTAKDIPLHSSLVIAPVAVAD